MRRAPFILAVSLTLASATFAAAQNPAASPTPGAASALVAANRSDANPTEIEITLAPVTASGAPRSFQVVSLPVPQALAQFTDVLVAIIPKGEFVVLGPRARELNPRAGKQRLAVTIGIPATALAGRVVAAEARFSALGSPTLVVPIEIDITLVRKILLRQQQAAINAQAGSDVVLPLEIVNSGNATEKLAAHVSLPTGWATRDIYRGTVAIGPGEIAKRRLRLKVPALSSTGSSFVRVDLVAGSDTLASETMTVEVFNSGSIGHDAGPLVTTAISGAVDENGKPNRIVTLNATGALFDSVRIDARMSRGSVVGGAASNAFAHLGTYQSAASVVFTAPSGHLSLGNTGTSFSDLTGLYPYGQGALLNLQRARWSVIGLGAVSMNYNGSAERKPMFGVRGEHQLGLARVGASATHLEDEGSSPRKLDAVGIGAAMPAWLGSTFKAEIAERRFATGSGFGWSSALVRLSGEGNEELRISHAPGGSDAFARATDEMVANFSERIGGRGLLSASVWRTVDATSVFSDMKSNGFSVRPHVRLFGATTIAIEGRSYEFDATSRATPGAGASGFGSREQQLGIDLSSNVRQYYFNTAAYLGNMTRTVSPIGLPMVSDRTPRNYWTTAAGYTGAAGVVELQMRIEQTRDRGGFVNQQSIYGIRGDQLVVPWFGGIRADGALQRVNGFGDEKSSIARAGLAVPIMNGLALKIGAERNSVFHSTSGKVPWIFGVRVEQSLTVPMLRTPGTSGYVFRDLNGNQQRDVGEPGVAGAIVHRGGETAIANGNGKYRVSGDARLPVIIDESSLPDGWSPTGAKEGDLAVALSTSAQVELVVAPRVGFAPLQLDLTKARVIARDSAGREWIGVMTGPTTATFQSLPVGTYKLDFDLSEISEPLVPRAPVPVLVVTGQDSKSVIVTLDPRPVRMWNGSGSRGAQKNDSQKNDSQKNGSQTPDAKTPSGSHT